MKLITTHIELQKNLKRLIEQYPHISLATAWASANTEVFKALVQHEGKIDKAVIGTHFYQTHPDVLDHFVGSAQVKFILQPDGVFHPKVYLFWSNEAWELLIGSANMTVGAFTKNSEMSVLITSNDGSTGLQQEISNVIEDYWVQAKTLLQAEADSYRKLWKFKARDLKKVADIFGDRPTSKPAVHSKVMPMDWASYLDEVKKDKTHGFDKRLAMLRSVEEMFAYHRHFNDIPFDARRGIAGLASDSIPNSEWFGSMTGAGTFYSLINQEHPAFSLALDEIPLVGDIHKEHYERFIEKYLTAYPSGRDGLGTATRLLAMKRPDVFLCVDAQNRRKLAEDIGIVRVDQLDYDRYWEEVVLRLRQCPWWQSPEPSSPTEKAVWRARAAMLDAIFYEEKVKKR